ncbi:MAG: pyridoxal phosphate-dependent deaminase, putative [Cytophagales bacterium]|nr:1-aminocyclopropane-1-carboxylate deaminase/D-cysteine desulfhydrase [Bacteroidota bacterium]MBS1979938.1 1-aminocyclopropane-1-carboxylate deaminase/D-cysteine desulfhydrase [Bacteroidota bacterium]WHZ07315.1 MAG: pyridoxal phosphate-dependent deaminase, putative [Cytophagales bacterium]
MLKYAETQIIKLKNELLKEFKLKILVKREDENHPLVSGNKWWKLKYNLEEAQKHGHHTLLTFGGAFSNHIYATAAAAKELGLKTIGIIRGEKVLPLNDTLSFAAKCGMNLHFVSREEYRTKHSGEYIDCLHKQFGDFYLIPEGGTNELAVKGCAEFARKKLSKIDFDCVCLPVGTGGTLAGIISGLPTEKKIIGFSVLKNGEFLNEEVKNLVKNFSEKEFSNWHIETDYHFGGYAKKTNELDQFILQMKEQNDLPLEFVYSGKMVAGVFDLISKNYFSSGAKILMLHTGGLRNLGQ